MRAWELIWAAAFLVIIFLGRYLVRKPSAGTLGTEAVLWLAQGFGLGDIPVAPGTFGSIVGLFWFALLLASGRLSILIAGTIFGIGLSIWACDIAERHLRQKDPGSVVLDEIAAMPVCFIGWVFWTFSKSGALPDCGYLLSGNHWFWVLAIFVLFRIFDVSKPWPVGQSQSLPGGWGITIDDVLAAFYVNLVVIVAMALKAVFSKS